MKDETTDPGITWDNKEQEVIENNDKVLNEVESQLVEILSAQDWGNSFIKVKVLAPQDIQDKMSKLPEDEKELLSDKVMELLRHVEDVING